MKVFLQFSMVRWITLLVVAALASAACVGGDSPDSVWDVTPTPRDDRAPGLPIPTPVPTTPGVRPPVIDVTATPTPVADRSVIHWRGQDLFLLGANYPYFSYANDFGANAWGTYGVHTPATYAAIDADFARMRAVGMNSVRWFMFSDGRSGILYDDHGMPTGIDEYVLLDLDAALEIAERHQILVTFVLLDFMFMWDAREERGVQLGGRADLINTAEGQKALIDNVFVPVFKHAGDHPYLLSWEIMNEPEWAISDEGDPGDEVSEPSTLSNFRAFTRDVTAAIHEHTGSYATVGAATAKWLRNWTGLGLDYYQVHFYDWMIGIHEHNSFGIAADGFGLSLPIVMGEFPADNSSVADLWTYLDTWHESGFAGAWLWSFRGGDDNGIPDSRVLAEWSSQNAERLALGDGDRLADPPGTERLLLRTDGNRLVFDGEPVRLIGVNRSGSEFACVQGWGIFEGPVDDTAIDAMLDWGINTVRVPLNEHCWLALDGSYWEFSGIRYQQAIAEYVERLTDRGMFVILDLHWTGPGTEKETAQAQMPSREYSVEFWWQVALAYRDNPRVIFDLFNEPYPDSHVDTPEAWRCLRDGGTCRGIDYEAAGMQELVDTIRAIAAPNLILVPGIQYGNTMTEWLDHMPVDPFGNMAAKWHSYHFNGYNTIEQFDEMLGPILQTVPLVAAEIGGTPEHLQMVMEWLDAADASYLVWVWNVWDDDYDLITDYGGTPTSPYGRVFQDHLAQLTLSDPAVRRQ
jgi:endoglucanase